MVSLIFVRHIMIQTQVQLKDLYSVGNVCFHFPEKHQKCNIHIVFSSLALTLCES